MPDRRLLLMLACLTIAGCQQSDAVTPPQAAPHSDSASAADSSHAAVEHQPAHAAHRHDHEPHGNGHDSHHEVAGAHHAVAEHKSGNHEPRHDHTAHTDDQTHAEHAHAGHRETDHHRANSKPSKDHHSHAGEHRADVAGHQPNRGSRNGNSHGGHDGHRHAHAVTDVAQAPDRGLWKADVETGEPQDLFARRILPILKAESSSCSECHFVGVDLKNFILADQAATFASLRERGLIDVQRPDESKLLEFIARTPGSPDELAAKVRRAEFQAFRSWIHAAVKDPNLLEATATEQIVGTELPVEVIRHARKDRVLHAFVENVWSQMGRCISCHSPDRNQRLVKKHGEQVSWIVPHNPAATLEKLVDAGNIDTDAPEESPLLTKPAGLSEHGGGPKFLVGGPAYHGFLSFLTDYAAIVGAKYKAPSDLPRPSTEMVLLTEQHLRLVGLPEACDKMPLQVDLYRWDPQSQSWSKDRWGTAFNRVNGKRQMWQSLVSGAAPRDSARAGELRQARKLPGGKYLAKLYLDRERKTEQDPNYRLGEPESIGQVEFGGEWPAGYQPPKVVEVRGVVAE